MDLTIVVGVDGSEPGLRDVEAAARRARQRVPDLKITTERCLRGPVPVLLREACDASVRGAVPLAALPGEPAPVHRQRAVEGRVTYAVLHHPFCRVALVPERA